MPNGRTSSVLCLPPSVVPLQSALRRPPPPLRPCSVRRRNYAAGRAPHGFCGNSPSSIRLRFCPEIHPAKLTPVELPRHSPSPQTSTRLRCVTLLGERMRTLSPGLFVCLSVLLWAGCVSRFPAQFTGDYLGYDEARRFCLGEDAEYGPDRPKYLMEYYSITMVETITPDDFDRLKDRALFPSYKGEWFYFSVPQTEEYYIWEPDPADPARRELASRLWAEGLHRYRISRVEVWRNRPTQPPVPMPGKVTGFQSPAAARHGTP